MYSGTVAQNTAKEPWFSQKSENTKSHNAILNFYEQITHVADIHKKNDIQPPHWRVRSLSANCQRNRFFFPHLKADPQKMRLHLKADPAAIVSLGIVPFPHALNSFDPGLCTPQLPQSQFDLP